MRHECDYNCWLTRDYYDAIARRHGASVMHYHEYSGPREGQQTLILRYSEFGSRTISRTCAPEDFRYTLGAILRAAARNRRARERRWSREF